MQSRLGLTRQQILAFRRRVGGLDERLPAGSESLRRAAWAGLQDSMPRAALLSLHARVEGSSRRRGRIPRSPSSGGLATTPTSSPSATSRCSRWEGCPTTPRAACGPSASPSSCTPSSTAARMTDREVCTRARHRQHDQVRRDDGHGRDPLGRRASADHLDGRRCRVDPADACRELARRYLHIFGPTTAERFARWAGISRRSAANTFASLEGSLLPVRSPLGDEWLLADDEPAMRAAETRRRARAPAAERRCLLPARRSRAGAPRPAGGSAAAALDARVSGRARSSSKARSAEPGDGRTTPYGSTPGHACRAGRATRSRPRPSALPLPGVGRRIEVVWEHMSRRGTPWRARGEGARWGRGYGCRGIGPRAWVRGARERRLGGRA